MQLTPSCVYITYPVNTISRVLLRFSQLVNTVYLYVGDKGSQRVVDTTPLRCADRCELMRAPWLLSQKAAAKAAVAKSKAKSMTAKVAKAVVTPRMKVGRKAMKAVKATKQKLIQAMKRPSSDANGIPQPVWCIRWRFRHTDGRAPNSYK